MTPGGGVGPLCRLAADLDRRWIRSSRRALFPGTERLELPSAVVRLRRGGAKTGTPVVVVPDPPNTVEHYDGVFGRLSEGGPVAGVAAPGCGFSVPRGRFRFEMKDLSRVLEELLPALGFRGATLSLACVGAFAALDLAARRPDLVARLVLSQVASRREMMAWVVREDLLGVIQTPFLGQVAVRAGWRLVVARWYRSALPEGTDPGPWEQPTRRALSAGAGFPLASAFQVFARDPGADPPPLKQPVTVLFGAADRTHGETDRGSLAAEVPGARLLVYPRAGHFPDLENADEWIAQLRS